MNKSRNSIYHCPNGHNLPHLGARGECTPLECAGSQQDGGRVKGDERVIAEVRNNEENAIARVFEGEKDLARAEKAEKARLDLGKSRVAARLRELNIDPNMPEEALDGYVRRELAMMRLHALSEYKWRFLVGNEKERWETAQDLMDRTGHAKGDKTNMGGAVIILSGNMQLPWAQPSAAVVEGQVVPDKKKP